MAVKGEDNVKTIIKFGGILNFTPDNPSIIIGDINKDGKVDILDLSDILSYPAPLTFLSG